VRNSILVVEKSLLHARTIAAMYEAFDCEVTLATDVAGAIDLLDRSSVDVVIVSQTFYGQNGMQTRDAIKAARPGLRIAVMGELGEAGSGVCSPPDFHVRPTHFYTDLCWHMSLAGESWSQSESRYSVR
jgi:DNA-binding NtrC family response regulator